MADFSRAAADAAETHLSNPEISFAVHDPSASLPQFFAVLAFNTPRSLSPWSLCKRPNDDVPTAGNGSTMRLVDKI